ncbi:MAG: 50S ribosomal protein L4, partial [uncultured bacterium]
GEQALPAHLFAVKVKPNVVHQVVVAQQANSREVLAHTKTKGEVRGGGRKPWKQKGTGRARQGSIRNPQWRGGGVVFGPRSNRNFAQKVNKRMKQAALAMVLSDKAANDKMIVVDAFTVPAAKTKQLKTALNSLPCAQHSSLLALAQQDTNVVRAAQNIAKLGYCAADSLNVVDILKYEYMVIDQAALKKIEETFRKSK